MDQPLTEDHSSQRRWWLLAAVPVIIHGVLLYLYSVNAPRLDDFSDGLVFLPAFYGTDDWAERFRLLFTMYQNHRWGLLHGVYALFRCIDFRLAGFLSLPWLILFLVLWYRETRSWRFALPLLAIASLLVFNLHSWTGMFWITASLAAFPSICLALLAFMLLTRRDTAGTLAAILVSTAATMTNGNGVLLWPLGMLYLAWQQKHSRQPSLMVYWMAASCAVLFLFFSPDIFPVAAGQEDRVTGFAQALLGDPLLFVQGALATAGSHMLYFHPEQTWRIWLAVSIGLAQAITLAWLLWRGALRDKPALLLLLLFTAGTLAAIAASRVMFLGMPQAFQGHYKLYNSVLLLLLIAAMLDVKAKKSGQNTMQASALTGIAATFYVVSMLQFLPDVHNYHRALVEDTRQWLYSQSLQRPESRYLVKNPNRKLETAVAGGFYDPWTLVDSTRKPAATTAASACNSSLATPLQAKVLSHKNAHAIYLELNSREQLPHLLLCSPLYSMTITIKSQSYHKNENGTHRLELWVPRMPDDRNNAGPWQVYAMP